MVSRVLEHVRGGDPMRKTAQLAVGSRTVFERPGEPLGRQVPRPVEDQCVGRRALARELREVGVHVGSEGRNRVRLVREASEPDAIAPQHVIERPVHRTEECAAVARAFIRAEFGNDREQPFVHPAVVAREELAVFDGDHERFRL